MILDYHFVDSLKKEISKRINFKRYLKDSEGVINMKVTDSKYFTVKNHAAGYVILENPNNGRADDNKVSIEKEIQELTVNNINYNIAVQFLAKELAHLRDVAVFKGNGK